MTPGTRDRGPGTRGAETGLWAAAWVTTSLLLSTGTLGAQQYPTRPPEAAPLAPAPFPPFQETVLPNGLRLLVVENHRLPVLSVSLSFSAGKLADPPGKEGLAAGVAGLLTKGAGKRSAEEISAAIEGVGGSLEASAGNDFLSVRGGALSSDAALLFELLADAVMRPAFPQKELELLRTQTLSALQLELSQPEALADAQMMRAVYGEHPYARRPTPASVRAVVREDLLQFQHQRLRPKDALVVVAGDITLAQVRRYVMQAFRGWLGAPPPLAPAKPPPSRTRTELFLVHRPGSVQSNIVAANLTFAPADPRVYAATVANKVLGGGADARLFAILREQKSWTYGAFSSLVRRKGVGDFEATTEVRTEVTDSALTELLAQLRRLTTEPIPAAELESAKGALVGSYPLSIQTAQQVASAVAEARLYGLAPDYVQTYRVKLAAISAEQALAAAKAVIHPDAMVIVVVGDAAKLYDKLKDIAPITLLDPEGKPLERADLAARAGAVDLDLAALVPRRDSFAIRAQGNTVGWMRSVLDRSDQGFRYTEDTDLGILVRQTTVLDLSPEAGTLRVKQTGTVQGEPTSIDVSFAGGRAKGTAKTVGPDGAKSVTIDTTLAEGTLDDNAIQALLPAFRWRTGAKWTLAVFSASENAVRTVTLAVSATEPVTLEGGLSTEAYRAELTGGLQPVTFWVTTVAPYRLLKIAIAGTPVEMVRVK